MLLSVPRDRLRQRLTRLLAGLVLYGASDGMLLLAGLGVDPWDVFHQGLSRSIGLQVGTWVNIVGALVLLGWLPLRQRPGVGTVLNVLVIGTVINGVLAWAPAPHRLPERVALLLAAVLLNGIATGLYIGAGLGPGPRDGLMTGIAARGHSVRVVRTVIEVTVMAAGWLLGGTVGVGTLLYAAAIGPIVHLTLPALRLRPLPVTGDAGTGEPARRPTPTRPAAGHPGPMSPTGRRRLTLSRRGPADAGASPAPRRGPCTRRTHR